MRLFAPFVAAIVGVLVGGCALFGIDPNGDDDAGDDAGNACADEEALLVGQWITPEGATTASLSYNLVTYQQDGPITVQQWSSGSSNQVYYVAWAITSTEEGTCDKIVVDVDGSGWLPEYSKIWQLDAYKLDLEATDGSYYGARTRYDRWMNGGTGPTCQDSCDPNDPSYCEAGQACLYSADGYICLSPECQACWDQGYSCTYQSDTCQFTACG